MCCGNSILQKGLPFFYLHKIFYTLVDILFLNDKIENIRGTVINIFEDSMRVEVETTKKHLIILKTAIATITLLD
jgi:hypothetical protein